MRRINIIETKNMDKEKEVKKDNNQELSPLQQATMFGGFVSGCFGDYMSPVNNKDKKGR